jgi:hypothetical protein
MAFLAPFFLALAAFAGVPLLVHLLRRRVGRTVEFPSVRYLLRMEQEHSRERKLRNRLLLLLRMLAALAIALAAARPIARLAGMGHAPAAVALVIDNSMSSGGVRDGQAAIDDIKADARAMMQSLTPDDRAWIVTADGRVLGGSPSALAQSIEALQPLGGRGDLVTATRRAATLATSGAPRAPLVAIVSDGQATSWQAAIADSLVAGADANAASGTNSVPVRMLMRSTRPLRNSAVIDVSVTPSRWTPSGVVNFAVHSGDSIPWRIALDGRTVARGTAPSGTFEAPAQLSQRLSSSANGWVRGSVELDADELLGDDARWFAIRVAPPPSVAILSEAGPFLTAALATMVDDKRLARGTTGARGVVTVAGADANVPAGAVFLTAPLDPVQVGEANRTLARLGIPWRFGAIARDGVLARGDPALDGVQVRVRYPLQYSPGGANSGAGAGGVVDTIATAGGKPWAVSGDGYVVLASPLEPEATDLPLRAAFVPWVLDVLSQRLGEDGRIFDATPGQHIVDRVLVGMSALERPDGTLVPLSGDRLTVPNESGVYFLRRQATRVGAVVVNPEAEESDVRRAAPAAISSTLLNRVQSQTVVIDTIADDWRNHALDQAAGRSLLIPLLIVALIALVIEAILARGAIPTRTVTP